MKTVVHRQNLAARASILMILIWLMILCQKCPASANPPDINTGRTIRIENIRNSILHMQSFGNRTSWQKQWETARWLEGSLRKSGLSAYIDRYESKDKTWPNVIGEIRGITHPDQKILLIAHFDSVSGNPEKEGAPGADDNGSGVAILLELSRILASRPMDRSIQFAFFSNEEQGQQGSMAFAAKARQNGADIRAVINVDVLGYGGQRNPFYPGVAMSQKNWKTKLSATKRMGVNYFKGHVTKGNGITVNGRPANSSLVKIVAQGLASNPSLLVQEVVKKDCG